MTFSLTPRPLAYSRGNNVSSLQEMTDTLGVTGNQCIKGVPKHPKIQVMSKILITKSVEHVQ